jgi:ABC-type transport system involved in cytochrome bd biosynthesis fused ATPase/permease subunit
VPLAVLLVGLAPRLAVVAACVFVPFSIALGRARRAWKRANARAVARGEALLEAADDAIRNAELWTTYGAEARVRGHVMRLGAAMAEGAARVKASAAALTGANEALGALALVLALGALELGWLGAIERGVLLSFAVAFFLAYRPLRDLADARLAWARGAAALEGLDLGVKRERAPLRLPGEFSPVKGREWGPGNLEVRDLVLSRGTLAPLSLTLEKGKIAAITGATGVGKTTLLRTLLGLEAPSQGDIRYDGAPLVDAPPGPGARPFAWVPQEAPLLADTLDANVRLGADVDPREALSPIGAEHLVDVLGDAKLGAGGRAVSGGERQWIALARAVATRQPILLLDEPTSGLDARAQERVLDAISRLRADRSVLLVTHRPEPLAIADLVVRV